MTRCPRALSPGAPSAGPGAMSPFRAAGACRIRDRALEHLRHALIAACLLAGAWPAAQAAGSEPSPSDPTWLLEARKEIEARRFDAALTLMRAANATDQAEWHNLMGYALRSRRPPDLATAESHYKRALEIEPKHRSALEYYGELMLMKKDLPGALALQARLEKACFFGCKELKDLREEIARYKAAGGK